MTEHHIREQESGFTLLELLVTVGIMAAVAGTATLALQDTTARASAAAHVAMMDELNEGIMTYRALPNNNNSYPTNFDSLLETGTAGDATVAVGLSRLGAAVSDGVDVGDLSVAPLPTGTAALLADAGIDQLRVVDLTLDPPDDGTCANLEELVNSRGNAVVPGNLYLSPAANGCGFSNTLTDADPVMWWSGGNERVIGSAAIGVEPIFAASGAFGAIATQPVGAKFLMAVGAGPSSTLFDASELGGMTSVPVYRHVANDEYNRFFILFHVATAADTDADATADTFVPADQAVIVGVVDGAGDTKEEELGEWDGTRNTI